MPLTSILHIGKFYHPIPGGMETHLRSLVAYQSQRAEVEVIVAGSGTRTTTEFLDGARITRVATFGSIASMPIAPSLLHNLRGRVDDLVHLHMPNPGAAAAYLLSGHAGKLIVTHHGDTTGRALLRRAVEPFVRRVMQRAAAIIVTSQRYLDSSAELEDFRCKCHVIPLGIDLENKPAIDDRRVASIRGRYGPRIILAMGRLVPYKGFAHLIRSLRTVDATLLLIGTGPLLQQLQETARSAGVADRTHFLGYIQDVTPYLHSALFFVLPSVSRSESFGLVQLEAMAAGLPVINTNLPSAVPEVSVHGLTGLTVPPANEPALTSAMQLLLGEKERRQAYGRAAMERAAHFSAESTAARTFALYEGSASACGAAGRSCLSSAR